MKRYGLLLALFLVACSNGNSIGTETGNFCDVPDDCYQDLDTDELSGDVICLDRVPDGYCTHECATDADCCAADGECTDDSPKQVCAPFESTGIMMCFLACDDEVDDFCQENLSDDFSCRSTGGGSENRKICSP